MAALDGKVAFVTGAGRGLGRAFARGLAREGARVVVAGRRVTPQESPQTVGHTARMIAREGGQAHAVRCDVRDASSVAQAMREGAMWGGGIDVLVNNAGMYYAEDLLSTGLDQWRETLGGFLTGVFIWTREVVPHMERRGGGSIINLGSSPATSEDAGALAYSVARAGTDRFTVKAAASLREANIAVNALGPGFTDTERVRQVIGPGFDYTRAAAPEDSVPPLVFLAQQTAVSVTGQVVFTQGFGSTWGPGSA